MGSENGTIQNASEPKKKKLAKKKRLCLLSARHNGLTPRKKRGKQGRKRERKMLAFDTRIKRREKKHVFQKKKKKVCNTHERESTIKT